MAEIALQKKEDLAARVSELELQVETEQLSLERKDMVIQKLEGMYLELQERYEREMACYSETVDYMMKTHFAEPLARSSIARTSSFAAQETPAGRAEQLARSLNMDLFK